MDFITDREQILQDRVILLHIFCFLILIAVVLQSMNLNGGGSAPILYVGKVLPLLGILLLLEAILLVMVAKNMVKNRNTVIIIYIVFPLLIAMGVIYFVGNSAPTAKILLLLPVLTAAAVAREKTVYAAALASIAVLLAYDIRMASYRDMAEFFNSNFVFIGTIVIAGWFSGATIKKEARYRSDLIQSKKHTEDIVNFLPDATFVIDLQGKVVAWNKAMEEITGIKAEDMIGKGNYEYALPFYKQRKKCLADFMLEPEKAWETYRENGLYSTIQRKHDALIAETFSPAIGRKGTFFWTKATTLYNENGQVTGAIQSFKDISEIKQLEQEVARMDRLNLVGELAASIAHEIRNPITTVRGMLQLMSSEKKYQQDDDIFGLMIEEIDRANLIIAEYLSLARNKMAEFQMNNLKHIIEVVYPLIKAKAVLMEKNIALKLEEVPDLLLDEKEIRQLLLNLVSNGLEAMEPGGCLTIKTFSEEKQVVLAVKDEGHGISEELQEQLGQPFLTTKENGTGLGLPVCYNIASRHNAKISYITGKKGTEFLVRFIINRDLNGQHF